MLVKSTPQRYLSEFRASLGLVMVKCWSRRRASEHSAQAGHLVWRLPGVGQGLIKSWHQIAGFGRAAAAWHRPGVGRVVAQPARCGVLHWCCCFGFVQVLVIIITTTAILLIITIFVFFFTVILSPQLNPHHSQIQSARVSN